MFSRSPQSRASTRIVKLCALYFLQAHAQALWYVPFSNVLKARGYGALVPYAFATSSVGALLSPMLVGVLVDRRLPAQRVLRWLAIGAGLSLAAVFWGLLSHAQGWVILGALQVQQFFYSPTWSIATVIVLASLREPERDFGPVRAWGTFGWLAAGPVLSYALHADVSLLSGFAAAGAWLLLGCYTFTVPDVPPADARKIHGWRDLLGFDAMVLLRDPNHRAVLVTAALLNIPLAAFYPYTIMNLREAGNTHAAAAMSLGQVTEAIAMFSLAPLMARFGLKTILTLGLGFGVLRYALFAIGTRGALLAGVSLHGACYTLVYITAQIYLDRRAPPALRGRAQALLTLLTAGWGNFVGALLCGWWHGACTTGAGTDWCLYWALLSGAVVVVTLGFVALAKDNSRLVLPSIAGRLPPASRPMDAAPE